MNLDEERGKLIAKALDQVGFSPRNSPMVGDSYRYFIKSIKNEDKETMEIYKKKDSDDIIFSGAIFLAPNHHEKYRHLDDDIREKFHKKLKEILSKRDIIHDTTEDERGFAVWFENHIHHQMLTSESLSACCSNVIDTHVEIYNFFADFFYDKITL